jgi:hypothetical protein
MNGPSALPIARALGALAAMLLNAPTVALAQDSEVLTGQRTRGELAAFLGAPALRCIASSPGLELCAWQLGDRDRAWKTLARSIDTRARVNVLCEIPADGSARAPDSCSVHPRESDHSPWALPNLHPSRRGDASVADRRAARERVARRAQATLDEARTLLEISVLIGEAPDQCQSTQPGIRTCLWRATSRTQGHGMLAATIEAPRRKKVRLECRLPVDGTPREPGSCEVEIGD